MIAGPGDNVRVRSVAVIDYDPANSPLNTVRQYIAQHVPTGQYIQVAVLPR